MCFWPRNGRSGPIISSAIRQPCGVVECVQPCDVCPVLRPGQFSCQGLHVARGDELSQPRRPPMTCSCEHRGHRSGDSAKGIEMDRLAVRPQPFQERALLCHACRLMGLTVGGTWCATRVQELTGWQCLDAVMIRSSLVSSTQYTSATHAQRLPCASAGDRCMC